MAYVYVCPDWYRVEDGRSYDGKHDGFPMEERLKDQLDLLIKNAPYDWNFTLLVCGEGEMRVGKSVIGMQIGAYWSYMIEKVHGRKVPFTVVDNLVFNGFDLVPKGDKLGKNYKLAFLDYDEAADDLEGTKVMRASSQAVKDYLRKAAQYNMLTVLVQSEFFEIPKPIALSRSTAMINVSYYPDERGILRRGNFEFYSKRSKKLLYLFGKKELNYHPKNVKPEFFGHFPNFYPLPESEYRAEKFKALQTWKKGTQKELRLDSVLTACLKILYTQTESATDVANMINNISPFKVSLRWIQYKISGIKDSESEIDEGV